MAVTRTQMTRVVMSNATIALGAMGGEQGGTAILPIDAANLHRDASFSEIVAPIAARKFAARRHDN